jgi:TonB family protein
MTKWEDDIRRYHSGEMTPPEQHALEKKALSDPFLAEALEGAGLIAPAEYSDDLIELESKIETRSKEKDDLLVAASAAKYASEESTINLPLGTETKNKMHRPWMWPLRIAASIALIAFVYYAITPLFENEQQLALKNNKEEEKSQEQDTSSDTLLQRADEQIVIKEPKASKQSSKPEKVVDSLKPREEVKVFPSAAAAPALADRGEQEKEKISEDQVADGDVMAESQNVAEANQPESKKEAAQVARSKSVAAGFTSDQTILQGKVVSAEDGTPLPGVNIIVKGTTTGTVTDIRGNYQLTSNPLGPTLVYSFIGMQTQEVKANDQSELTVKLKPDPSQLSEVVVMGYSPMKDDTNHEPIVKLADPVGGRHAYDNYLKNSLHYPQQALDNQIKGRVTVQFTVRTDGSLHEFSVLKGLGFGCDEEAIRLVKEGPKWSPTTEDAVPVESEVRIRVKFAPQD